MSYDLVLMNFIINNIVTSSLVAAVHGTLEIAKKTNFIISLLQIGANYITNWRIFYYQLGQVLLQNLGNLVLLQIGASLITNSGSFILLQIGASVITNWGSFFLLQIGASVITNWGSLIITNQGKFYYKSGQLLQIRATVITNWGKLYYKLGQLLQIEAIITNWSITAVYGFFSVPFFPLFRLHT